MSYLVFWSDNAQRKKRFLRNDIVRCATAYCNDMRKLGSVTVMRVVVRGKWKLIHYPLVFDESTTPPTLMNDTITDVAFFARKNDRFPRCYISPVGHIRESATDKLVMERGPSA